MRLRLVEVREVDPPAGVEPLHWRLLTTHDVADAAAAWQIVGWYQLRWVIEQMHRVLKSQGLQLEDSQLATAERLEKLAAVAVKAACIDIQLTQERDGKHQLPGSTVFTEPEMDTVEALVPTLEGKYRTAEEPSPGPRSRAGELGRRSPGRVELLLQAARPDHLPARHGAILCHPSRQGGRNAAATRCENPLA